ncbi:hypothetical protein SAMN05443636_1861 [Halobaculum gomorrense]|uniref:Uncharacterized protein n=1 Tax=Halobaculum gomorrense TaxID=43928 RepID=A0A1M5QEK3_9EURY|nr:hypothetical protein SAMN05443636_1861 [Halobaculum gomorrense]
MTYIHPKIRRASEYDLEKFYLSTLIFMCIQVRLSSVEMYQNDTEFAALLNSCGSIEVGQ